MSTQANVQIVKDLGVVFAMTVQDGQATHIDQHINTRALTRACANMSANHTKEIL